jgi:hypothetical protein
MVNLFHGYNYFQSSPSMVKLVLCIKFSWFLNLVNLLPKYNYYFKIFVNMVLVGFTYESKLASEHG